MRQLCRAGKDTPRPHSGDSDAGQIVRAVWWCHPREKRRVPLGDRVPGGRTVLSRALCPTGPAGRSVVTRPARAPDGQMRRWCGATQRTDGGNCPGSRGLRASQHGLGDTGAALVGQPDRRGVPAVHRRRLRSTGPDAAAAPGHGSAHRKRPGRRRPGRCGVGAGFPTGRQARPHRGRRRVRDPSRHRRHPLRRPCGARRRDPAAPHRPRRGGPAPTPSGARPPDGPIPPHGQ